MLRFKERKVECCRCGMSFPPSAGQLRLIRHKQPVYCSAQCGDLGVLESAQKVVCLNCSKHFAIHWGRGFDDYLWDSEKNNFCSLSCLYDYLMRNKQVSFPPLGANHLIPLALMAGMDETGSRGAGTRPQQLLFSRLSEAIPGSWMLEYSISTGLLQPGKPKYYRIDIANPDLLLAIECDGPSHETRKSQISDRVRDLVLSECGWKTLRFTYSQIESNIEKCIDEIAKAILWQSKNLDRFNGSP